MRQWVKISFILASSGLTACTDLLNSKNQLYIESQESFEITNDCSPTDSESCTYLKASYPVIAGPKSSAINQQIEQLTLSACSFGEIEANTIEAAGKAFIAEYKEFQNDVQDSPIAWEIISEITWNKAYDTLNNLSHYFMSYTGGAHGNSYQMHQVYSNTGNRIELQTLFIPSFEGKLSAILDHQYREMKGLKPTQSLINDGNLFVERIKPTNNFYFTENSIHFVYNAYDIAPYVEGTIDIKVPLHQINHLLRLNSK